jgi:hypothetical protein
MYIHSATREASQKDLKSLYMKAVLINHPDKIGEEEGSSVKESAVVRKQDSLFYYIWNPFRLACIHFHTHTRLHIQSASRHVYALALLLSPLVLFFNDGLSISTPLSQIGTVPWDTGSLANAG